MRGPGADDRGNQDGRAGSRGERPGSAAPDSALTRAALRQTGLDNTGRAASPAELASALSDALRALTGDVRVLLLRARTWSAGPAVPPGGSEDPAGCGDAARTAGPGAGGQPDDQHVLTAWQAALRRLDRPDLISVAVVDGPAAGPRLALALACDLRVMTEDATLRLVEPQAGLVPWAGVAGPLVDLVGYARALELCLTGRPVTAGAAAALGLANRVLPRDRLEAGVDELVSALLGVPRPAATETKALLRGLRLLPDRDRRDTEAAALARCLDAARQAAREAARDGAWEEAGRAARGRDGEAPGG